MRARDSPQGGVPVVRSASEDLDGVALRADGDRQHPVPGIHCRVTGPRSPRLVKPDGAHRRYPVQIAGLAVGTWPFYHADPRLFAYRAVIKTLPVPTDAAVFT